MTSLVGCCVLLVVPSRRSSTSGGGPAVAAHVIAVLALWGSSVRRQSNRPRRPHHEPMSHYMTYAGWLLVAVLDAARSAAAMGQRLAAARCDRQRRPAAIVHRNAWVGLVVGLLLSRGVAATPAARLRCCWSRRLLAPRAVLDKSRRSTSASTPTTTACAWFSRVFR
jgi:hypothetical protein